MHRLFAAVSVLIASASPARGLAADPVQYFPAEAGRPFSAAVRVGDVLYISGVLGLTPAGSLAPGGLPGEAAQVMENIGADLRQHGLGYDDVFKCTVMLADMARFNDFNAVYVRYFKPGRLPARSAFGANGLALGGQAEVECWAAFPKP